MPSCSRADQSSNFVQYKHLWGLESTDCMMKGGLQEPVYCISSFKRAGLVMKEVIQTVLALDLTSGSSYRQWENQSLGAHADQYVVSKCEISELFGKEKTELLTDTDGHGWMGGWTDGRTDISTYFWSHFREINENPRYIDMCCMIDVSLCWLVSWQVFLSLLLSSDMMV